MKKSIKVQTKKMISWPLEMLLRIFSIWPGVPYGPFCKVFWLIVITLNTILQWLFIIYRGHTVNSNVFIYAFVSTLTMHMRFMKVAVLWYNQRRFNEMWETMSMNWTRSSEYKSAGKRHVSHYLPNIIVTLSMFSVIMTSAGNLSGGISYDGSSNGTRSYVLLIHVPFDNLKQSVYLFILFQQLFYLWLMAATSATINSVLIIFIMYLGDQIDIICTCLTKIPPGDNDRKANVVMMKEMIRKHQNVITFAENVEALYTYIALMLVVFNTLISCGVGFVLVRAIGTPHFAKLLRKNLLFYCTINIETFVYCFAGEYISAKSKAIGEAAYYSRWYQSKFHGRAVLFMIMRSQNQLTITVGKIIDLSLELFTSILKTSMSYMSVLLAMY
ncbi:odorant receptor 13a-like [Odontomachus brunneus]|uniref:odorant receptor 13a-like n=1 Tax=Odontomachus brunneus TaxID=486640 RepID=UPI0013F1ECA0|nr:odorant receptor 13a-like [Odontomachus brunneus]